MLSHNRSMQLNKRNTHGIHVELFNKFVFCLLHCYLKAAIVSYCHPVYIFKHLFPRNHFSSILQCSFAIRTWFVFIDIAVLGPRDLPDLKCQRRVQIKENESAGYLDIRWVIPLAVTSEQETLKCHDADLPCHDVCGIKFHQQFFNE